jgi:hypothetical protein
VAAVAVPPVALLLAFLLLLLPPLPAVGLPPVSDEGILGASSSLSLSSSAGGIDDDRDLISDVDDLLTVALYCWWCGGMAMIAAGSVLTTR